MQVENHKLQDSKVKDNSKTQKLKIKKLKIQNLQFRTKVWSDFKEHYYNQHKMNNKIIEKRCQAIKVTWKICRLYKK
jgi:hypothetical protein